MSTIEITWWLFLFMVLVLLLVGGLLAVGRLWMEVHEIKDAERRTAVRQAEMLRRLERVERLQGMVLV